MNRQRKLIKSVCIAGLAGVLAAGGIAVQGSVRGIAEGLAAAEDEVIVLTPENMEALKARLAENPDLIIILEDGTRIDLAYLETLEAAGQTVIVKAADVEANPALSEVTGTPDGSVVTENPAGNPGEQGAVDGAGASGGENVGTGTPENAGGGTGTPENPGTEGTPGSEAGMPSGEDSGEDGASGDHSESGENPGETGDGSEDGDKPGSGENPGETGDGSEDGDKPGSGENPGESGDGSEDGENPGETGDDTEDKDKPGETGDDTEDGDKPGESGDDTEDGDKPGSSGEDTEDGWKPGEPGNDAEDGDKPGSSGEDTEDGWKPGKPGNDTEDGDKPGSSDWPGSSDRPNDTGSSGKPGNSDGTKNPGETGDSNITDDISDKNTGFGSIPDKIIVDVDQFEPDVITPDRINDATVILNRKLVKLPKMVDDFRFWTVARKYAFAREDLEIREKIPGEEVGEETVRAIGSLKKDGLLYILKEENNGWLYVESGRVRGFVRPEKLMTDEEAKQKLEEYQDEAKRAAEEQQKEYTGIEDMVPMAEELVSWKDNEAFTYLRATVDQTVVDKRYAVAKDAPIEVKEDKDVSSRVVGVLPKDGLCYVIEGELEDEPQNEAEEVVENSQNEAEGAVEDSLNEAEGTVDGTLNGAENIAADDLTETDAEEAADNSANQLPEEIEDRFEEKLKEEALDEAGWVYIESGDVRGFVRKESLSYGEEVTEQVEEAEEDSYALAEEKIKPEDNAACYYTLTSTKPGTPSGEIRKSMVEFAAQFIGNPYVWGGTSLTDGADCSGFVQSIYKQYGYDIPRVACDQAEYGIKIPVEDALPGDLIFYAKNGYIHHVVMYAGGGKTIEAMSSFTGIVQADVRTDSAVWATRVLDDNGYEYADGGISEVNATPDMYGKDLGTFELTYYCACELCCDVETGITATGAPVVEGRTIAVDPRVIPYGTQVIIGGHIFTAEDCGGAIKGNHIDIYVNDHARALALGVNYANVYLRK